MKKIIQVVIHRTTRVNVVMDVRHEDELSDVMKEAFEIAYNNEALALSSESSAAISDIWDVPGEEKRTCSICGKPMNEGYCLDGGLEYYCSDECLHRDFTDEEWQDECKENPDSYWTTWY